MWFGLISSMKVLRILWVKEPCAVKLLFVTSNPFTWLKHIGVQHDVHLES